MKQEKIDQKIKRYKDYKKKVVKQSLKIRNVSCHKMIHPFLCGVLTIKRTLLRQRITIVKDESTIIPNRPVIYAVTHIGRYDFEMVMEAIKKFFYALSGDWELMYGTVDDYFFRVNGAIYIDTEDKADRGQTYEYIVAALKQGIPILWCPEGIWNLSDHLPMLNLFSGIIRAAIATNTDIVPIAVDQRGKEFYISIGKNVKAKNLPDDKQIALRDIMATLKWEIWENFPVEKRSEIPLDYYQNFLKDRIREWPHFNLDIIKHREYRDKNVTSPDEAFEFFNNLKPTTANLFLFMKTEAFIKNYISESEFIKK